MRKLMTLGMGASAVSHDFHSRRPVPVDSCAADSVLQKETQETSYRRARWDEAARQETGMLLTRQSELVVKTVRIP